MWDKLLVGASLAICGCFALEIINLINEKSPIITKKCRFFVLFLFFSIFTIPMIRVYENRQNIKSHKNLKFFLFYGTIIAFHLFALALMIYFNIKTDDIGHLGGFLTGLSFAIYFHKDENEKSWYNFLLIISIKRMIRMQFFSVFVGVAFIVIGLELFFTSDMPENHLNCKIILLDFLYF